RRPRLHEVPANRPGPALPQRRRAGRRPGPLPQGGARRRPGRHLVGAPQGPRPLVIPPPLTAPLRATTRAGVYTTSIRRRPGRVNAPVRLMDRGVDTPRSPGFPLTLPGACFHAGPPPLIPAFPHLFLRKRAGL